VKSSTSHIVRHFDLSDKSARTGESTGKPTFRGPLPLCHPIEGTCVRIQLLKTSGAGTDEKSSPKIQEKPYVIHSPELKASGFPVVLFIVSYTKVLIFESEKEVLQCEHLFTVLYRVVLTFPSVDEILKCDCSNHAIEQ